MSQANIVSEQMAERLAALTLDDISAVVKLASLGLKAGGIRDYVSRAAAGEPVEVEFAPGAPRPLVIHAWSFVRDRGQYSATYGLSSADAGELMDLLHSDPEQACSRIHGLVSDRLRKRGSSRPVKVDLEGSPSAKSAGNSAPSSGDGGLALLRREVKRNSGVYGSYQFAAGPTKRPGGQAFSVDLGGGLWALGQSKAVAVAAARICRVLGRHEDLVRPYIYYWASGSSPRSAADISEKVWDGRLGPHEDAPPEPATKAKTEATK